MQFTTDTYGENIRWCCLLNRYATVEESTDAFNKERQERLAQNLIESAEWQAQRKNIDETTKRVTSFVAEYVDLCNKYGLALSVDNGYAISNCELIDLTASGSRLVVSSEEATLQTIRHYQWSLYVYNEHNESVGPETVVEGGDMQLESTAK